MRKRNVKDILCILSLRERVKKRKKIDEAQGAFCVCSLIVEKSRKNIYRRKVMCNNKNSIDKRDVYMVWSRLMTLKKHENNQSHIRNL